ncbi:MAG: peptide ABC transporter substrate-binding protein [Spirochaetales bacterium]|nr:peptide ABC transporter substrate-binding protein [Spirochaetales bacterium]
MKIKIYCVVVSLFILTSTAYSVDAPDAENTMTVALTADDITLDPLHSYRTDELQIATGIYEGLVGYHPQTLRPIPGAAYKWDISDDGRTYRFYLRKRAKFSNGDSVTAEDFRESWLRIINPEAEGEYSFLFDVIRGAADYRGGRRADSASVGIRTAGSHILVVELDRPASHFMSMLPHMSFAPIHQKYRENTGWEQRPADGSNSKIQEPLISNGPFVLSSWTADEMHLERNLEYWDSWHVALDGIRLISVDNPVETSRLLNNGDVLWADYADTSLLENGSLVQVGALFATSYLYFRTEAEPWDNPLVRKGLALLIPWNQLRSNASAFISTTLVPAVGFYEPPAGLVEKDVEKGLALLEEAGYPKGKGLPEISIVVTPGSVAESVATEAADIWKNLLDVSVEIVQVSFNQYTNVIRQGGYTMGSSTWIGDFADPLSFLQMWITGTKLNDARYSSSRYDDLIEDALSRNDESRFEILGQAEEILLSGDVVVLPLANPPSFNLVDLERVQGWYSNALDIHPFKFIAFRKPNVPDGYVMVTDQLK